MSELLFLTQQKGWWLGYKSSFWIYRSPFLP